MSRPLGWEQRVAHIPTEDTVVGLDITPYDAHPALWYPACGSALEVCPLPPQTALNLLMADEVVVSFLQSLDPMDSANALTARRLGYVSPFTTVSEDSDAEILRARSSLGVGTNWIGAVVISSGAMIAENYTIAIRSYNAERDVLIALRVLASKNLSSSCLVEVRCYKAGGRKGTKILIELQDEQMVAVGSLSKCGTTLEGIALLGQRKGRFSLKKIDQNK